MSNNAIGGGAKAKEAKHGQKSSYRLVDYVSLLGLAPDIKKSPDTDYSVLYSYPSVESTLLYSKLPQLCFPDGYHQSEAPLNAFFSALVITDERKHEYYLTTITFFLKAPHNNPGNIYLPYCLCVSSSFPMYHLFREVLYGAFVHHIKLCKDVASLLALFAKDGAFKRSILRFVDETPAPTHGKLRFILTIFHQQIPYHLPSLDDFPLHELPLQPLFTLFSPQKVLQLLNHMLFDGQLLFISADPSLLGVVLEGLRCLMYPLAWEHVYVPCLPSSILADLLQAPIPFMVGVCAKKFTGQISEETIVVEIGEQGGGGSIPTPKHPFPSRLVSKLCTNVAEIIKKSTVAQNWGTVQVMDSVKEAPFQMDVREAFLTFFVSLLRDVEKYVDVESDVFKEHEYLFCFSSRKQPFIAELLKTQAFEQLRLRIAMGEATMQLYKECVVAKYMEKSCKRVFANKREECAKDTQYPLPFPSTDSEDKDGHTERLFSMITDVTNLMTLPNSHSTQATLLVFRSSLHAQSGEYFAALQDINRAIQLDDSVVSDGDIYNFISHLSEIEISKAISSFCPRIKKCVVLSKTSGRKPSMIRTTSIKNEGLKAEQKLSVQLRQNISNLKLELGAVKRQNVAYKSEIAALREQVAELTFTQAQKVQPETWEEYDVIVDIRSLKQLNEDGWPVVVKADKYGLFEQETAMKGSIAAFVGLYNKGKTFLLNKLSGSLLPSGSKVTTHGISVKVPKSFDGQMIFLDTAGTHAPISYRSNDALLDRRASELFLQDLIFDITDYHICVVNDLTWQEQEYIDNLVKKLQNSQKQFKQVIVVHNFKGSIDVDDALDHWKAQIIESYPDGEEFSRPIHLPNGEATNVQYYISGSVRHVVIGKEFTPCGDRFNEAAYALLRSWLRDVVVEYGKVISPLKTVVASSNKFLSNYVEGSYTVKLSVDDKLMIKLDQLAGKGKQFHLRPFTLGWLSPKVEPDNFSPLLDRYTHDKGVMYIIELPGVLKQDLKVSQREWPNVYIEGEKKRLFVEGYMISHAETKSGRFKIKICVDSSIDPTSREMKFADSVLQIKYNYYSQDEL